MQRQWQHIFLCDFKTETHAESPSIILNCGNWAHWALQLPESKMIHLALILCKELFVLTLNYFTQRSNCTGVFTSVEKGWWVPWPNSPTVEDFSLKSFLEYSLIDRFITIGKDDSLFLGKWTITYFSGVDCGTRNGYVWGTWSKKCTQRSRLDS